MPKSLLILVAAAGLATNACDVDKTPSAKTPHSVSVEIDSGNAASATSENTPGKVEIRLPDGIGGTVDVPGGLENGSKFDIAGVGLYPGAKVGSIKVNAGAASNGSDSRTARVQVGFAAPGDAAAVADWYQGQFAAKGTTVTRRGESLSGTTDDGDAFTLAITPAGTGASRGVATITDRN